MPAQRYQPFVSLPYQRIDLDHLAEQLRRSRLRIRLAMKPDSAASAIRDAHKALLDYAAQSVLARIRYDLNTEDAFYADEVDFYDQAEAQVAQMKQAFYQAMTASRFRGELQALFGLRVFERAEFLQEIIQPIVVQDIARENKLISQHRKLIAGAQIDLYGHSYNLAQLEPLLQLSDRSSRMAVWQAKAGWFEQNSEKLNEFFDQLIRRRTSLSQKLGFAGFTDVACRRMQRYDYGQSEIESVRDSIKRYIVPLTREIRRLQRKRLGLDILYDYDMACLFPQGEPQMLCTPAEMPGLAAQVLADLTGQRPSFLTEIIDSGYIDWKSKPHKVPAAYCSMLYRPGVPFIFINGSGSAADLFSLMHQAGHAYASLRSLPDMELIDCHRPPPAACEIQSTSMEYLTYPYLERFFGPAAEQVSLMHMTQTLLSLPVGCMLDEFQHLIYTQPEMSPEQRQTAWLGLEQIWLPDQDHHEIEFYKNGSGWQEFTHLFDQPFYAIDFVLAQLTALDIWKMSRIDLPEAFHRYDRFCKLGGKYHFNDLLTKAGFASPFETDTIKRLAYAACDYLSL